MSESNQSQSNAIASGPPANVLQLPKHPDQTEQQAMTEGALNPAISCAMTAADFLRPSWTSIGVTEAMHELTKKAKAVNAGDLKEVETMLVSQAFALNAMFVEMSRRAHLNMGNHMEAMETYMRLAMKCQNQTRMTLETLAAVKNPPVVYAKQANINNGGQQQVNNGVAPQQTTAHTAENTNPKNELLKASHGERLDFGAQTAASATHQDMATVGEVHRPQDGGWQGQGLTQRRQRRPMAGRASTDEGTAGGAPSAA